MRAPDPRCPCSLFVSVYACWLGARAHSLAKARSFRTHTKPAGIYLASYLGHTTISGRKKPKSSRVDQVMFSHLTITQTGGKAFAYFVHLCLCAKILHESIIIPEAWFFHKN
jgi:hypothetical protein